MVTISLSQDQPWRALGVLHSLWAWSLNTGPPGCSLRSRCPSLCPLNPGQHSPASALRARATPDTAPKHGFSSWSLETPGSWQPKQLSPSAGRSPSVGEKGKGAEYQSHLRLEPLFSIRRFCSLPPSLPLCCCQINEKLTWALRLTPEPQAGI